MLAAGDTAESQAKSKPMNILFLMTDQQQAATVDPGSPCLTPNLARLSERSVRFTRAYTINSICSPARASLYTGLLPSQHGMVDCTHTVPDFRARFRDELPMWSRSLKDAGYRMGHFGKWHVERSMKLENFGYDEYCFRGSQEYKDHQRSFFPDGKPPVLKRQDVVQPGYDPFGVSRVWDLPDEAMEPHFLYSKGMDFIRRAAHDSEQPWCTFVSLIEPHDAYDCTREIYDRYRDVKIPKPASFDDALTDRPNIYRRAQSVWDEFAWEDFEEATRCYYGACTMIDNQVGRILDVLDQTGQRENTIIVFTADHGDQMGAHRLLLKGVPAFEESYNIPLIVCHPGMTDRGRVCGEYVNTCDLCPTLLEMADLRAFPNSQGRSIMPLLRGEKPVDWPNGTYAEFHGQRFFYTQRTVWEGDWKFVFNGFDYDELYDLKNDPHEMRNLAGDPKHRERAQHLAQVMWRRIEEVGDFNMRKAQYGMFRFAPLGPASV